MTNAKKGTIAVSWGPSGGFYLTPRRVCLGRVAITLIPHVEIEDLMESYLVTQDVAEMAQFILWEDGTFHARDLIKDWVDAEVLAKVIRVAERCGWRRNAD